MTGKEWLVVTLLDIYFMFDDWCLLVTLVKKNSCNIQHMHKTFFLSSYLLQNTSTYFNLPWRIFLFFKNSSSFDLNLTREYWLILLWEIFTFYPSCGRKFVWRSCTSNKFSELVRRASNHGAERSKYITISVCHKFVIQFYHWIYKGLVHGPLRLINLMEYPTPSDIII